MSNGRFRLPLLAILTTSVSIFAAAADEAPVALFNGRNLDGWSVYTPDPDPAAARSLFVVSDGTIHTYADAVDGSKQPMGYVATTAEYANYRLSLEFKWGTKKFIPRADPDMARDAGVCYHVQSPDVIWPVSVECQIQEGDTGDAWLIHTQATARIHPDTMGYWPNGNDGGVEVTKGEKPKVYRRIPRYFYHEQPGWNRVELVVRGDRASYYVNGHLVNEVTQLKRWDETAKAWQPLAKGRILLQAEGAEIFYRNVTIQALPAQPSP
ncbi:MAG TPA: DUF1080 domain-containing protein [Lacunisphaera sp.]|nr:DUF1080 domain-containing protein [Lacunisphaera sp.]